jgi:hypothetical protein
MLSTPGLECQRTGATRLIDVKDRILMGTKRTSAHPRSGWELPARAQLSALLDASVWSRRSFLSVLGIAAAGAAVPSGRGHAPQALGASRPLPPVSLDADRGGSGADGLAVYSPVKPYALTSQSVLSEDYFEVVNHSIEDGDKVIAYTRADGQVEAMVLQDGIVKRKTCRPGCRSPHRPDLRCGDRAWDEAGDPPIAVAVPTVCPSAWLAKALIIRCTRNS